MNLHLSYLYSLSNPYSANLQTEIGWVPPDPNLNWVEIWVTLFSPRYSSMTRIFNIGTTFQSQKTRSNCLFSKEECDLSTWLVSRYWLLCSKAQVLSWQMFVPENLILLTTNIISIIVDTFFIYRVVTRKACSSNSTSTHVFLSIASNYLSYSYLESLDVLKHLSEQLFPWHSPEEKSLRV